MLMCRCYHWKENTCRRCSSVQCVRECNLATCDNQCN